jgi:hypothetical protein
MKYSIEIKGDTDDVKEHIKDLKECLELIIKQDFAQVGFLSLATHQGKYYLGVDPANKGLALVVTEG